jgi:hypothetical protein
MEKPPSAEATLASCMHDALQKKDTDGARMIK